MTDARPVPTESLVSLLDQLHDIAEPPPVSMMPATWGWAILAACLLVLLAAGVWAWLRHRRRTAYRRAALAELDELAPALVGGNDASALAVLDRLLRRTALVAFPRAEVATLTGSDWIAFLDRTGGRLAAFAPALATGPYARHIPAFDGPGLLKAARHWIARHHA